jgi:hypothetical protein
MDGMVDVTNAIAKALEIVSGKLNPFTQAERVVLTTPGVKGEYLFTIFLLECRLRQLGNTEL